MLAALPDLAGQSQPLSQWKGRILVVNFWATWCAPCREEIPALIEVQNSLGPKGLQIVGIAIDQAERVKPYAAEMRINYPILIGELDAMDLAQQAGNQLGGLPFTVILDRSGKPVRTELGGLEPGKAGADRPAFALRRPAAPFEPASACNLQASSKARQDPDGPPVVAVSRPACERAVIGLPEMSNSLKIWTTCCDLRQT